MIESGKCTHGELQAGRMDISMVMKPDCLVSPLISANNIRRKMCLCYKHAKGNVDVFHISIRVGVAGLQERVFFREGLKEKQIGFDDIFIFDNVRDSTCTDTTQIVHLYFSSN